MVWNLRKLKIVKVNYNVNIIVLSYPHTIVLQKSNLQPVQYGLNILNQIQSFQII